MQATPGQVLEGLAPTLKESTIESLPTDGEQLELLRRGRIRYDGFFTGPSW
jgi:hypothetical protein